MQTSDQLEKKVKTLLKHIKTDEKTAAESANLETPSEHTKPRRMTGSYEQTPVRLSSGNTDKVVNSVPATSPPLILSSSSASPSSSVAPANGAPPKPPRVPKAKK